MTHLFVLMIIVFFGHDPPFPFDNDPHLLIIVFVIFNPRSTRWITVTFRYLVLAHLLVKVHQPRDRVTFSVFESSYYLFNHSKVEAIPLKGSWKNYRFTSKRYLCINKNFWWFRFFQIRLTCWEIWKNVQNETTKPFSVGNIRFYSNDASIYFCICCTMTRIKPMVKSRPSMKKR